MKATGSMQGETTEYFEERYVLDKFYGEVQTCKAQGLPTARIGTTVGRSVEFGEVKCSFTVTIECPQNKECMDEAAQLVFIKALEYANDGMSHLKPGIPRIEIE
jgi:hypothetical protein